jgi:hypothetical protein
MRELLADLVRTGRFDRVATYQRFGYLCGAALVLSGLVHAGVYLVDGGPWEGPVSWRKPIVFGLSFGITVATLTWFLGFLRLRRTVAWAVVLVLCVSSLGEVFLISMQRWRDVASHFNETTPFDGMVFSAMGMLVTVIVLVTALVAVLSFTRIDAPASLALAIRLGLLLMLVSQAVGVQMIVEGGNTYGADGALKVPHAVTLHAVQVLPALALALLVSEPVERRRMQLVGLGALGYGLLIASTMTQTYAGRGPLTLGVIPSALALLGVVALTATALVTLRGLGSRLRSPTIPAVHPRTA